MLSRPSPAARVILCGVAIALVVPAMSVVGWNHHVIEHLSDRDLLDDDLVRRAVAPLKAPSAAIRLVAGLLALPGLLTLAGRDRAGVSQLARRGLQIIAIAWPLLSCVEIALRLRAPDLQLVALFGKIDVLTGLVALDVIRRAREVHEKGEQLDSLRLLLIAVLAVHLFGVTALHSVPDDFRRSGGLLLGVALNVASIALGTAIAWFGAKLVNAPPAHDAP